MPHPSSSFSKIVLVVALKKRMKRRTHGTSSTSTIQFSGEEIQAGEYGQNFPWNHRNRPEIFDPVQIRLGRESPPCSWCDWWSSRSTACCCLFPIFRWIFGFVVVVQTNKDCIDAWKKQIQNPLNKDCPESMQGLWWLKYNHAPENLVTIFSDCEWKGTFNKEGTDGYGEWGRHLAKNWSRDYALLGWIFMIWGSRKNARFRGRMNLKDGICTIHGKRGEGIQIVYRINDNEWWKVHYNANPVRISVEVGSWQMRFFHE